MGAKPGTPHHTGRPWLRLRLQVLERDQWTCQLPICKFPTRAIPRRAPRHMHPASASVDMILPKSLGGDDRDPRNLRASHLACNSSRGNKIHNSPRWTTTKPQVRAG